MTVCQRCGARLTDSAHTGGCQPPRTAGPSRSVVIAAALAALAASECGGDAAPRDATTETTTGDEPTSPTEPADSPASPAGPLPSEVGPTSEPGPPPDDDPGQPEPAPTVQQPSTGPGTVRRPPPAMGYGGPPSRGPGGPLDPDGR